MKNFLIALAILGIAMLSSCVQEKSFEMSPLGENDIAFMMENAGTRSMETVSDAVKGVTLELGTTPDGEPLVLEETIEELNPGPATKGAPAYTKTVGKVHPTMGVYSPNANFGDAVFGVMDENLTYAHDKDNPDPDDDGVDDLGWRYQHNYGSNPWPNESDYVDFYFRMPVAGTGVGKTTPLTYDTNNKKVTFSLNSTDRKTAAAQEDLLFGFASLNKKQYKAKLPNGYPVTMFHALSGVKFANGHENGNQTKTIITRVEFTGLVDKGTLTINLGNDLNDATNTAPAVVTVADESVTTGFMYYQDYSDPEYDPDLSDPSQNKDGTVNYVNVNDPNNPDATIADFSGTSWVAAAADHNLNDKDGSLTFWFIPQTITSDVKLTVYFQIKTPDTPNGIDLKPITINFGDLVNGVGTENPKTVVWKAGQLRTYTLKPYEVDVEIEDKMNANIKSNVHIANTGNVDEYVRVLIMGNWYGWKSVDSKNAGDEPSILVGYQNPSKPESGDDPMVLPWYREGYPCKDGVYYASEGEAKKKANWTKDDGYGDPYGHFDDSFPLAILKNAKINNVAVDRDGKKNDWADASGGFYYTMKIGPGEKITGTQSATTDLFKSYTVTDVPTIYLPSGGGRAPAVGVHLVMEIVVQAIEVPKDLNGNDIWWLEAWYRATEIGKLDPNGKKDDGSFRNAKYRNLFKAGEYYPAVATEEYAIDGVVSPSAPTTD